MSWDIYWLFLCHKLWLPIITNEECWKSDFLISPCNNNELQLKIILEKQRSYGTFRCILRRQGEKEVNHSVLRNVDVLLAETLNLSVLH